MNLGDTDTEQCKTKVNIYFPTDIFLLRLKIQVTQICITFCRITKLTDDKCFARFRQILLIVTAGFSCIFMLLYSSCTQQLLYTFQFCFKFFLSKTFLFLIFFIRIPLINHRKFRHTQLVVAPTFQSHSAEFSQC